MFYTGDPCADFDAYDAAQTRALTQLPRCEECGEYIQDDYYYDLGDGAVCADCLERLYRKDTYENV